MCGQDALHLAGGRRGERHPPALAGVARPRDHRPDRPRKRVSTALWLTLTLVPTRSCYTLILADTCLFTFTTPPHRHPRSHAPDYAPNGVTGSLFLSDAEIPNMGRRCLTTRQCGMNPVRHLWTLHAHVASLEHALFPVWSGRRLFRAMNSSESASLKDT